MRSEVLILYKIETKYLNLKSLITMSEDNKINLLYQLKPYPFQFAGLPLDVIEGGANQHKYVLFNWCGSKATIKIFVDFLSEWLKNNTIVVW
jgi:hypothetical protein